MSKLIVYLALVAAIILVTYFAISNTPEEGKGMVKINQTYGVYKIYRGFVGSVGPIYIVDYYDGEEIKSMSTGDRYLRVVPINDSKATLVLESIYREYRDDKYNARYWTLYLPRNYTITGATSTYREGKRDETSIVYN